MSPVTNLSSVQVNNIEHNPTEVGQRKNCNCSCPSKNWQKIVDGTVAITNAGSLVLLIYGVATKNLVFAYIGAGCGAGISTAHCLLGYFRRYSRVNSTRNAEISEL